MEFIPLIPEVHHGPAIVIDIGSTKVEILGKMAELPLSFDPIGGHPMCGKELAGFENADPGIYHGAPFVLTPLERTSERAKNFALDLVRAVGAESVWLDPETHDSWVATTSHLPYLLSVGLVASAPPEVASVVGPGFRDVSRLAGSDRQMMLDILSTNKEKVLKAIRRFRENLEELEETMMEGDYSKLADLLERTSQQRDGFIEDQVIDETRD
jgi:prephenate dehydrogenase